MSLGLNELTDPMQAWNILQQFIPYMLNCFEEPWICFHILTFEIEHVNIVGIHTQQRQYSDLYHNFNTMPAGVMMILLQNGSVYDHGLWWLMIDHENWWSIIFDHGTCRPFTKWSCWNQLENCESKISFKFPRGQSGKVWFWTLSTLNQCQEIRSMPIHSLIITQSNTTKCLHHIQSSAIITRSNIRRFCNHHCRNWDRISIRGWNHERHPIPRPNGQAMGCLL